MKLTRLQFILYRTLTFCASATIGLTLPYSTFAQGTLIPPGAPAQTMKTLDQVEPRKPISSLPITITQPGSYYVTSNLVGAAASRGITVATNDVTIDLKGFSLIGVPGSFEAILLSFPMNNLSVYNGTIRNWGGYGIYTSVGQDCSFQGLRIQNNGNIGISAGSATSVKDCVVDGNGVYGISVDQNSIISGCNVRLNANGIGAGNGSVVVNCSSVSNANYGIYANSGVSIQACAARGNGGLGINAQEGSVVSGCSVTQNGGYGIWLSGGRSTVSGCAVNGNQSDGINVANSGNRIVDNVCSRNGVSGSTNFAGIRIDSGANWVEGNNLVNNFNRGLRVTAAGNFIIRNSASFHTVSYDITGSQTIGPIITTPGVITTNNPWANFEL